MLFCILILCMFLWALFSHFFLVKGLYIFRCFNETTEFTTVAAKLMESATGKAGYAHFRGTLDNYYSKYEYMPS